MPIGAVPVYATPSAYKALMNPLRLPSSEPQDNSARELGGVAVLTGEGCRVQSP